MSQPLIEMTDVDFAYDRALVLQQINLTINPGEMIAIFGPNGGGKTTFLRLIMGILKPTRGTISVLGTLPFFARTRIGYVPQSAQLDKQFPISVLDLVLTGCLTPWKPWKTHSKEMRERALEALHKVGLDAKKDVHFGTLSGGQCQRALIARAIATLPELLILDEPTSHVDPEAENEVYHLLDDLKRDISIMIVTHQLSHILPKIQRFLCINRFVTSLLPQEMCEHFALGLYHPPLTRTK